LDTHREALSLLDRLPAEFAAQEAIRNSRAAVQNNLGNSYVRLGRLDEAETAFRAAIAIYEQLVLVQPDNPQYRRGLAATHGNMASAWFEARRFSDSLSANETARSQWQQLVREHPDMPEPRHEYGISCLNLGKLYDNMMRAEPALDMHREAVATLTKLVQDQPAVREYQASLALAHSYLGDLYSATGRPEQAEPELRRAESLWTEVSRKQSGLPVALGRAMTDANIAGLLSHLKRQPQESLGWYDRAIQALEDILQVQPRYPNASLILARTLVGRADARARLQRYSESLSDWKRVLETEPDAMRRLRWQVFHAGALAQVGDHRGAIAEITALDGQAGLSNDDRFNIACVYGLAGAAANEDQRISTPDRERVVGEYGDLALTVLTKLHDTGFFKEPSHLKELLEVRDLALFQSRADFQELIQRAGGRGQSPM
jgi:tetratricopeptide (TPR) repeat protein